MKKNTFIFFLFGLIISCQTEDTDYTDFKMYNDTDKSVKVRAFDSNPLMIIDDIQIDPFSIYSVTKTSGADGNFLDEAFYSDYGVDSVRVIFNSNKVIVYIKGIDSNDIFKGDEKNECHITEEDYNLAVDCDVDCD